MQEHKTIVKNYEEYICFLKNQFGNCCCMPSYDEICDFIKKYHLDLEWDITPEDVVADVKQEIQKAEVKNRVSSYEEYLQALKEYFGIPDMMPESIKIEEFIKAYNLRNWEITVEDVREDLALLMKRFQNTVHYTPKLFRGNVAKKQYKPAKIPDKPFVSAKFTIPKSSSSQQPIIPTSPQKENKPNPPKPQKVLKERKSHQPQTILLDGDNHVNEAVNGIENTPFNTKIKAYFCQPGAKAKFDKKYSGRANVSSKLVKPGDQAVDNQIKSVAGQLLKDGDRVTIVSQDKGFQKFADKKKNSGNIQTARSVKESVRGRKRKK